MEEQELVELIEEAWRLTSNPFKRVLWFATEGEKGEPVFGWISIKIKNKDLTIKLLKSFLQTRLMSWRERQELKHEGGGGKR